MTDAEQRFLDAVASVLEAPALGFDDDFRESCEWCSLKAFGLLVLMENDFATPLNLAELERLRTVRELYSVKI